MSKFMDWLLGTEPMEQRADDEIQHDPSTARRAPSRRTADRTVTAGDAFTLSMAYRAISIHAISIKQLSLGVFRDDERVPTPLIIRKPAIDLSRSAFLEQTVVSLASNGNAYWRKTFEGNDSTKKVTTLTPLNPIDVEIEESTSGTLTGYKYGNRREPFKPEEIKHLKLLRVPGSHKGLGPIQAAQAELRGALDLRDYSSGWFRDSGVPTGGQLITDQHLAADQAREYKKQWQDQRAEGGTAVMGAGLRYERGMLNPKDAQFLESQQFTTTQLARLFGVPASLMLAAVEGNSQSYSNVEQDWLGYVRFSLMQYLIEIEDALTELLPGRQEAKFNVEALLRADTTTRYAAHKVAIDAGFMTREEVRNIEHLGPLPAASTPAPKEGAE